MADFPIWARPSKAHVCAKVEHPFLVIKQQFRIHKIRLRGIGKNRCEVKVIAGLTNLFCLSLLLLAA